MSHNLHEYVFRPKTLTRQKRAKYKICTFFQSQTVHPILFKLIYISHQLSPLLPKLHTKLIKNVRTWISLNKEKEREEKKRQPLTKSCGWSPWTGNITKVIREYPVKYIHFHKYIYLNQIIYSIFLKIICNANVPNRF